MIALIPMEIGPLATNQAAISVRQIQKFTTMAKTVQLAYMHKYVPKTQTIYTGNAVKEHYTLITLVLLIMLSTSPKHKKQFAFERFCQHKLRHHIKIR